MSQEKHPLIVQFQQQLSAFIQQREQVKVQFEQLQGAIFACEQMIKQYEESEKQVANENPGVVNDVEANLEAEKQVA